MSCTYLVWQYLAEPRMAIWRGTPRRLEISMRKHHSRNALNDEPGHHAFEVCVHMVSCDEPRSQPDAIAGASYAKDRDTEKNLELRRRAIGAVCILDAAVPSCGRGTMHGKKARCRSLIGDHLNPTQSCKMPKLPISLGSLFAAILITDTIIVSFSVMDHALG